MLDFIDKEYLCAKCKKININPYQSDCCGVRYCEECIKNEINCVECSQFILEDKSSLMYKLDKAFQKEINKRTINCSKCNWNGKLIEYQNHFDANHKKWCKLCNMEVSNIEYHSRENVLKHFEIISEKIEKIENETCASTISKSKDHDYYSEIKEFIENSRNVYKKILNNKEELKYKLKVADEELRKCQEKLYLQQAMVFSLDKRLSQNESMSRNGVFVWKISNFSERMAEAKSERRINMHSQPFYTSERGYKLCALVFLNGNGNAKDTHLSLFVVIMKGPYDNLLKWPFCAEITFTLLDQPVRECNRNVIESFKPDPKSVSFQKPIREMNAAAGIPLFCPHLKLFSNEYEYIKDDCIFIKVEINKSNLACAE